MARNMPEEMVKLRKMLDDKGIAWKDKSSEYMGFLDVNGFDRIYRTHWDVDGKHYSAICGIGTYGAFRGDLELMIDDTEPWGYLAADDVIGKMEGYR